MICTSCGIQIVESSTIYKCRQCVNHFVCKACTKKEHNRPSSSHHTLDKMRTLINSTTSAHSSLTMEGKSAEVKTDPQARSTSIFATKEYLTMFLSYCDHCLKVLVCGKDIIFNCDQCPNNFCICNQCLSLMPNQHPSMHTFSKGTSPSELLQRAHDLEHFDVICDRCRRHNFNGIRHHCEQCQSNYDLCEKCIDTIHKHHTFKIMPNSFLHAHNNSMLAKRTLDAIAKNTDTQNLTWRDPITGWTKSDAENMIQQAQKEQEAYITQLQNISEHELGDAKKAQETQQELHRFTMDGLNVQLSLLNDKVLYLPRR
ncbi:unnamed protein product [Rotaria sordida]|uniref:ZZ-type domain-containing protein n=2 Tax=Rotaria sordida TaxID=392033 RepID=A0A815C012_9BILA|nr:unnamed protein product [Rotaria sordida]CAF1336179.1 unnamed protein product [Rotaria sordida]CAF1556414.1 unnamed protein product [Rotaria sordida]